MNDKRGFDRAIDRWLDDGSDATPPEVIDAVLRAARSTPQERDFRTSWRTPPAKRLAYAVAAVAVLAVSLTALSALSPRAGIGPGPTHPDEPSVDLGIFEPVAGRIVYGDGSGIWGVDPAAPEDPATSVELTSEGLIPLGWSSDGTRLLAMRPHGGGSALATSDLLILNDDGSEMQVTERPIRIRGAAISPDGSRVVFAGSPEDPAGNSPWAVYAVDADGGPAEVLVESRIGILDELAFSPDGMRIAYADGAGDNNHHVWVMNADGSDAHEIVTQDCACHVYGLAWSPAGDRIALGIEGAIYTFAPDGSEFTRVITNGDRPYWSPDGSRIAYTVSCVEDANGCGLALAVADGSNVREFGSGASGPWHPGGGAGAATDPTVQPTQTQPPREAVFDVALHSYEDMSGGLVRASEPTRIHAQLPDGWVADESGMSMNSDEAGGSVAVTFWAVDAVFTEPCNGDGRADPPMMRSLDGLAEAFTGWWHGDGPYPGREGYIPPIGQPSTSQPADTTVSGLRARYSELRVPDDFDADECVGGRYATWRNADGVERHHRPGDVSRIWIVAVAPFPSTPLLVIDATSQGEPSPEGLTELAVIIDSLRIEARPEEAP